MSEIIKPIITDETGKAIVEAIIGASDQKQRVDEIDTKTKDLQSQIDNIISSVTEDAEVQNARVGADGTSHATLKGRLDKEITDVKEDLSYFKSSVETGKQNLNVEFAHGGWNSSGGNWNTQKHRIHNTTPLSFSTDTMLFVKNGYRIYGIKSDLTSTMFGWINGESWAKIPANTEFYIQIGRNPEDSTEIANIIEFSSAVYTMNEYKENLILTNTTEKNVWNISTDKKVLFNASDFEVGDIDATTGEIAPNSTKRNRIRTTHRLVANTDLFVKIENDFSAKFFLYSNELTGNSVYSSDWCDGESTMLIPKNSIFTLLIKRKTENADEILYNQELFLNKVSFDTYTHNVKRGYTLLNSSYKRGGMITSGTTSGNINPNEKYRVSSTNVMYADTEQWIYVFEPNVEYCYYKCNADGTVISSTAWQKKGYVRVVEAGSYYKITLQRSPKDTTEQLTDAEVRKMWESIGIIDDFVIQQKKLSVADLNKDKYDVVVNFSKSLPRQLADNSIKPLEIIHFSDIHGDRLNWERICDYIDFVSDTVSTAIHTGDYVGANQTEYTDLYSRKKPHKTPVLNVVGNHDTYLNSTNTKADRETTYGYIFNDKTNWDVVFGTGSNIMYYYKDFADSKIRLVVLDQFYWDETQANWLTATLLNAKENGYSVVTAMHSPTDTVMHNDEIDSTFKSHEDWSSRIAYSTPVSNILKEFKDNGGNHICNLGGHWHHDIIGYDRNGILNIIVPCASHNDSGGWANSERIPLERSGDCFNVIAFDVQTHSIRIARIGNNVDYFGQTKNILCVDYVDGTVIANS